MSIIRRTWINDSHLQGLVRDPVVRQLLAMRGVCSKDDLDISLAGLKHFQDIKDIHKAAKIIADSIIAQKHILIAGDYDVDGMTGITLGVKSLLAFGVQPNLISFYVPSRYQDGYGLNSKIVDLAVKVKVDLIITVDNGISACEGVSKAKEAGLQVVITDHHDIPEDDLPNGKLPEADAIVNPKQIDDVFTSKALSGVGVLFYVMLATRAALRNTNYFDYHNYPQMEEFLDLVALGTIGDVMMFDSNNRRLVKAGLTRIQQGKACVGIQALLEVISLDHKKVQVRSVAFDLCPRLNAGTRIKIDSNPAIMCLLCEDKKVALMLAKQLDMCNKRRMDYEKVMVAKAKALYRIEKNYLAYSFDFEPDRVFNTLEFYQELSDYIEKHRSSIDITSAECANNSDDYPVPDIPDPRKLSKPLDQIEYIYNDPIPDDCINAGIVIYDPSFLKGLVGLVAARLKEAYNKPCVIFGTEGDTPEEDQRKSPRKIYNLGRFNNGVYMDGDFEENDANDNEAEKASDLEERIITGSARSISHVNLKRILVYIQSKEPDLMVASGGHEEAAGVSIRLKDLNRFKRRFNEGCYIFRTNQPLKQDYVSECLLPESYINLRFAKTLENLGPWGKQFEEPKFDGMFFVKSVSLIAGRHLKLKLQTEHGVEVDGIKFKATQEEKNLAPGSCVHLLYTLNVDRYYKEKVQLTIEVIEQVTL